MSIEEALDKDMLESGWVKCPACGGCGSVNCEGTSHNDILETGTLICWSCHGSGSVPKIDEIRGLLFESMISDSNNLRQKCIWKFSIDELEKAIETQIKNFEYAIKEEKEQEYITEEYKGHLKRFIEWSEYFMLEAKALKGHK